jgi:hypothetical protein
VFYIAQGFLFLVASFFLVNIYNRSKELGQKGQLDFQQLKTRRSYRVRDSGKRDKENTALAWGGEGDAVSLKVHRPSEDNHKQCWLPLYTARNLLQVWLLLNGRLLNATRHHLGNRYVSV